MGNNSNRDTHSRYGKIEPSNRTLITSDPANKLQENVSMEYEFSQHLIEHRKDDKDRFNKDLKIHEELVQLRSSIDNLPTVLKETFVTKKEVSREFCQNNFNRMIAEHYDKRLNKGSTFISIIKGIIIIISSIAGSTLVLNSGVLASLIK